MFFTLFREFVPHFQNNNFEKIVSSQVLGNTLGEGMTFLPKMLKD